MHKATCLKINTFEHLSDQPKAFLIEQLEELKKAKGTKRDFPCLFDDTNIQSVFGMLDPTGKGYISHQQYLEGKRNYMLLTMSLHKFIHIKSSSVNKSIH